jgi:hypothetical protein
MSFVDQSEEGAQLFYSVFHRFIQVKFAKNLSTLILIGETDCRNFEILIAITSNVVILIDNTLNCVKLGHSSLP